MLLYITEKFMFVVFMNDYIISLIHNKRTLKDVEYFLAILMLKNLSVKNNISLIVTLPLIGRIRLCPTPKLFVWI